MEHEEKIKELNMTADEVNRFTKAFKDEKFRGMLRDYAQELSDPETKKKYEEEITLLEQERGNNIEFIHPEPFKSLRTSVNGKQKCYINICGNDKVDKPECKWGLSEDGRRGQCWTLPHSLHPGREVMDPKGNKSMIYDVIFHPDTLHIARKNTRFMEMVDSTAIQTIQDNFKVTLDKNNVREVNTKYKGTPQPCATRKPIPGYQDKDPSEPRPAFPYPKESLQVRPIDNSSDAKSKSFHQESKEPTKPNYNVKYRSFFDLQDFRCYRDSAKTPRPKEIVVTIDLPLLRSVADTRLEVKEKSLLLESKKPDYRLELPLSYPVDEEKGEAKFNKQRGQLTVTMPVLPSHEAFEFAAEAVGEIQSVSRDEREYNNLEEEDKWKAQESEDEESRVHEEPMGKGQGGVMGEESVKEEMRSHEKTEGKRDEGICAEEPAKWKKQKRSGQEEERGDEGQTSDNISESGVQEEQRQESEEEKGKCNLEDRQVKLTEDKERENHIELRGNVFEQTGIQSQTSVQHTGLSTEDTAAEKQPLVVATEQSFGIEVEEINLDSCLESTNQVMAHDIWDKSDKTKEVVSGNIKVEKAAAFLKHTSGEGSQTTAAVSSTPGPPKTSSVNIEDDCISKVLVPDEESCTGVLGNTITHFPDERTTCSEIDGLPTAQIIQEPDKKHPPVLLREIDKDGNETVISDHSTSAGFVFQNSLLYELD